MMKSYSVFDIIGPVMVGPSSSHTAGAARLGLMAQRLCGGDITAVDFYLYGSFAKTYRGHGTDKALLAGILGIGPDDYRLKDSFEIAGEQGIKYHFIPTEGGEVQHPNTVTFLMWTKDARQFTVTGSSIGGGNVVITDVNGIRVFFTGEWPILVTRHYDTPGVISQITTLLYRNSVNIGNMRVQRIEGTDMASMFIELDGEVEDSLAGRVRQIPGVQNVILLNDRF